MCGSRYCSRAREGLGRACSLRWRSELFVRARTGHHNRSAPHKRPAAAPCKPGACRAPAGGSTGDARHLVDDHRWPRQASAAELIDDLRARGTGSEAQHRAAGGRHSSRSQVHTAHTGRPFEESGSGLRRQRVSPDGWPACEAAAPELAHSYDVSVAAPIDIASSIRHGTVTR